MARPEKELSAQERKLIKELASYGTSQEKIGELVGMSRQTIAKHCTEELKYGRANMLAVAQKSLFNNIKRGCITSICFYLKTQHNWRERAEVSDSGIPEVIMFKRAANPE